MRNETFEEILRSIRLPLGTLLFDEKTYRVEKQDFRALGKRHQKDLNMFEKFLVLSDGERSVVGGVLFYGAVDIQATMLEEYRGRGFMSAIHHNGIMSAECYEGQKVSIVTSEFYTMDEFLCRNHLLKMAGLTAKNLPEVYAHLRCFRAKGIEKYDEAAFVATFS